MNAEEILQGLPERSRTTKQTRVFWKTRKPASLWGQLIYLLRLMVTNKSYVSGTECKEVRRTQKNLYADVVRRITRTL